MSLIPPILLASTSPRRREILTTAGYTFTTASPSIAEIMLPELPASHLCQVNAYLKARELAPLHPHHLIIAADTLVALDETFYGKPKDLSHAAHMLQQLSGKTHQVHTGVALIHPQGQTVFCTTSHVTFKTLNPTLIHQYHQLENPLDKAGSYAIQSIHSHLILSYHTGSYTNIMGLPIEDLQLKINTIFQKINTH
jgi:septum formation protein